MASSVGPSNKLKISFMADNVPWARRILGSLDEEQNKILRTTALNEIARSISIKLKLYYYIVGEINHTIDSIKIVLSENSDQLDLLMHNNQAFDFPKYELIYRTLFLIESLFINMKTILDLLKKYATVFERNVLGNITYKYKFPAGSLRELEKIRDDFIHNYSGWPFFRKINEKFVLELELVPDIQRTGRHKITKTRTLNTNNINEIINEFTRYYSDLTENLKLRSAGNTQKNSIVI